MSLYQTRAEREIASDEVIQELIELRTRRLMWNQWEDLNGNDHSHTREDITFWTEQVDVCKRIVKNGAIESDPITSCIIYRGKRCCLEVDVVYKDDFASFITAIHELEKMVGEQ